MKKMPNTAWNYSNGEVCIDPYHQKIIWQSGQDRHQDAMESVELLSQYIKNSNVISPYIKSNIELNKYEKEINQAVEYYSSFDYIKENQTVLNIQSNDLNEYSSIFNLIRKNKNRSLIGYLVFILLLNLGIYAATFLNERIVFMFIISAFVTGILIYTIITDFLAKPKFGKGIIAAYKGGESSVLAGKNIHSTSLFIVIGQHHLYNLEKDQIDTKKYASFDGNTSYQISKELYNKQKPLGSEISFITSSKNEIFKII